VRRAVIEINGSVYRDKQECLDHIDWLERVQQSIHGLEIVKLSKTKIETNMYKTVWFVAQDNVYDTARNFIREQMVGLWNYAEFK
jgi:gamma-glutamylcyclotransferase (GGCT)/AIG2-like uncharacterized protein YtfP